MDKNGYDQEELIIMINVKTNFEITWEWEGV